MDRFTGFLGLCFSFLLNLIELPCHLASEFYVCHSEVSIGLGSIAGELMHSFGGKETLNFLTAVVLALIPPHLRVDVSLSF